MSKYQQRRRRNTSALSRRQNTTIMENSSAEEIDVDGQTEELVEANFAVTEIAGREGQMEMVASENGERSENLVQVSGGYRRDRPPEDDCCPICHGDFHIPCRTSCGHWFCGDCVLQIWKYANFRQCVCPICGSLILNLFPLPHSSALIQPGEEDSKILEEIKRYSSQNMVGRFGIFKKAVALPHQFTGEWLQNMSSLMKMATAILQIDRCCGYPLFPKEVRMLIFICCFALLIFVIWRRWRRLRGEMRMAEQNVIR